MSALYPKRTFLKLNLELFILVGGTHPVVLSAIVGEEATYKTKGEAFVLEIMDGVIVYGQCKVAPADPDSVSIREAGAGAEDGCGISQRREPGTSWKPIHTA
jgi:hypothetical protein